MPPEYGSIVIVIVQEYIINKIPVFMHNTYYSLYVILQL